MRKLRIILGVLMWVIPIACSAQEGPSPSPNQITLGFDPVEFGFRFDDNVYRSPSTSGRLSDEIYLLNLGGVLGFRHDVFRGDLSYHLGADQYQLYSTLSNLKNDFNLFLAVDQDTFSFYYKKEYFLRNSQDFNFDYIDNEDLIGVLWAPTGPWNYETRYKNYSRQYYSNDPLVRSRNFFDQGVLLSAQREIDEKFSLKMEGSYNNRQFSRYAVEGDGTTVSTSIIQTDETWTLLLNAHLYFESILQDVTLAHQRTNSNSYGFSNTVQSVSWAGVVRPVSSLYLQLLFRLYFKTYDEQPLVNPYLQVGFIDEDSQDLLSIRTTWEWSPQWMASLGLSRVRSETTQPGMYYIKNILSAQVRRNF